MNDNNTPITNNNNNKRGAAYLSISRACSLCKRDHKACNGARPCARCISSGFADKCEDVVLKTRGRPRKKRQRNGEDGDPSNPPHPQRPTAGPARNNHNHDYHHHKTTEDGTSILFYGPHGGDEDKDMQLCHNISFYISSFPSPSNERIAAGSHRVPHPGLSEPTSPEQLSLKFRKLQSVLQEQQRQQSPPRDTPSAHQQQGHSPHYLHHIRHQQLPAVVDPRSSLRPSSMAPTLLQHPHGPSRGMFHNWDSSTSTTSSGSFLPSSCTPPAAHLPLPQYHHTERDWTPLVVTPLPCGASLMSPLAPSTPRDPFRPLLPTPQPTAPAHSSISSSVATILIPSHYGPGSMSASSSPAAPAATSPPSSSSLLSSPASPPAPGTAGQGMDDTRTTNWKEKEDEEKAACPPSSTKHSIAFLCN